MNNPKGEVIAGFPEFWQEAHDVQPDLFQALHDLEPLATKLFAQPEQGLLHRVLRHLAVAVSNSFGAVVTLCLNGYGADAVRIVRSMFEGAITATYLKDHPDKADDYIDFHWVQQKRRLDYFKRYDRKSYDSISEDDRREISKHFRRVRTRFQGRKRKPRQSWHKQPLSQMAEKVGFEHLYKTFYGWASSLHHLDISALQAQSDQLTAEPKIAPSKSNIRDALMIGHNSVLHVLRVLNEVAALGFEEALQEHVDKFETVWQMPEESPVSKAEQD